MPKAKEKSRSVKEEGDTEEGIDPHGVINPVEAKSQADTLDQTMEMIQERVDTDNPKDIAEISIERIKVTLANTLPMMQDANMATVIKAVNDPNFKVLLPWSDKVEQLLEEIFPTEGVPQAVGIVQAVEAKEPLTETDQKLITKLFDALEVAHDQLAMACSLLGRLSMTLRPKQLMVAMNASIDP